MRFSVVIPAFNEERYLPALLDSLDIAIATYPGGREAIEVVVGDNASTDGTAELARRRGCVVAPVEKQCIAAARNGGARAASGEILCFVDADSRVHPGTFAAIDAAISEPGVVVGGTGLVPERSSFAIGLTVAIGTLLIHAMGIDGGVVFCRKPDFERVGGYDEAVLYAEDVRFLFALKRLGRFRRAEGVPTIMSVRKWDKYGDWHFFTTAPRLAWLYVTSRTRADEYAKSYWYDGRR
ncbi:hypothetical protein BWI17_20765 [Betaproteobacteria bacterium GR16-43]|nr:hypothetical protein BWI17_20765 [Betaproteobacteria bacterium GR16-43]